MFITNSDLIEESIDVVLVSKKMGRHIVKKYNTPVLYFTYDQYAFAYTDELENILKKMNWLEKLIYR